MFNLIKLPEIQVKLRQIISYPYSYNQIINYPYSKYKHNNIYSYMLPQQTKCVSKVASTCDHGNKQVI